MISQSRAHELFEYNDGDLIWRISTNRRILPGSRAGALDSKGYLMVGADGARMLVHRVIWLMQYGELPRAIDHIDRNPLNNRIENLRTATQSENIANSRLRKDNKTGFKGVCFAKRLGRFKATACLNRKTHNLGLFDTPEEAHSAYCDFMGANFGEYFFRGETT